LSVIDDEMSFTIAWNMSSTTDLTWVHVTSYGERDLVIQYRHCLYCIVTL